VIYNWKSNNNYDGASSYMNWVNNYYKSGPATRDDVKYQVFDLSDEYLGPTGEVEDRDHETSLYAEGNFVVGSPTISNDNWAGGIRFSEGASEAEHRAYAPHDFIRWFWRVPAPHSCVTRWTGELSAKWKAVRQPMGTV
jgi:hypothetical protein